MKIKYTHVCDLMNQEEDREREIAMMKTHSGEGQQERETEKCMRVRFKSYELSHSASI
jgi:hypothetical protein